MFLSNRVWSWWMFHDLSTLPARILALQTLHPVSHLLSLIIGYCSIMNSNSLQQVLQTSPPYQHHWQPLDSTRIPRVIYHSFWRQLVCPIIQVNDNILFQFAWLGVCIILLDFLRSIYSKRNQSGDVYHFERRGFSQHRNPFVRCEKNDAECYSR